MRALKPWLVCVLGVALAQPAAPMVGTQLLLPPATEITQLLNHAQLVLQLAMQAKVLDSSLATQRQALIEGKLRTALQWGQSAQELMRLADAVRQGQGLAYTMSNLDVLFRQVYPGYRTNGVAFNQQYADWNNVTRDGIAGILRSLNIHGVQLQNDQALSGWIRNFASTAQGQDQLLQAGTMIADEQVTRLDKLRQLMMLQVQSEATYQAHQINAEAVQQGVRANAFGPARFVPVN